MNLAILEQVREVPLWVQQHVISYIEMMVAYYRQMPQTDTFSSATENPIEEHPLARFYGICSDDWVVVDPSGIDPSLDDSMAGAFD